MNWRIIYKYLNAMLPNLRKRNVIHWKREKTGDGVWRIVLVSQCQSSDSCRSFDLVYFFAAGSGQ